VKCPLVLCGCLLEVVDEVYEALSFNGAMRFITNVKFGQLNGPGRHSFCHVWFLQYLLNWVIGFDDDVMVLEVWA